MLSYCIGYVGPVYAFRAETCAKHLVACRRKNSNSMLDGFEDCGVAAEPDTEVRRRMDAGASLACNVPL